MKKRVLPLLMLLLLLTACGKPSAPAVGELFQEEVNTAEDVTMSVLPDTATAISVSVCIRNNSEQEVELDDDYVFWLQTEQDGQWFSLEKEPEELWDSPPLRLLPGEETEMTFFWDSSYGTLDPGHYQVTKICYVIHGYRDYTTLLLAADFTVS